MAKTEKVAFAEAAVTVHVARSSEPGLLPDGTEAWDVESKVLAPGDILPLSQMPKYLSEAVEKGTIVGLRAMTPTAARKRAEEFNTYGFLSGVTEPDDSSTQEPDTTEES